MVHHGRQKKCVLMYAENVCMYVCVTGVYDRTRDERIYSMASFGLYADSFFLSHCSIRLNHPVLFLFNNMQFTPTIITHAWFSL